MTLHWDRHKNVAGLNQLMGYQPSPSGLVLVIYMKEFERKITKSRLCMHMEYCSKSSMHKNKFNLKSPPKYSMK